MVKIIYKNIAIDIFDGGEDYSSNVTEKEIQEALARVDFDIIID